MYLENYQPGLLVKCFPRVSNIFNKIVTHKLFDLYNIFLLLCLLPDLVLSALPSNEYILTYQVILLGLISFNTFLKIVGLGVYYIYDRMYVLDIIYIGCGWCIFDYPSISVFRLLFIFKIIKRFNTLRSIPTIRNNLYRLIFIISQVYNEFTYSGTAFWIFLLAYIVTHIYAISSTFLFYKELPLLFGNYSTSMFTLIRFSTSQEWGDILQVMEIYGNEYFFYFLSFYIIIIVGFLNGLIVTFGNAFSNQGELEAMIDEEEKMYKEDKEDFKDTPINSNKLLDVILNKLEGLDYSTNLICNKLNIVNNYDEFLMGPILSREPLSREPESSEPLSREPETEGANEAP